MNLQDLPDIPRTTAATLAEHAWWYACGYNDNRADALTNPYVNPFEFAASYLATVTAATTYTPSIQDAFTAHRIRIALTELEQVTR